MREKKKEMDGKEKVIMRREKQQGREEGGKEKGERDREEGED